MKKKYLIIVLFNLLVNYLFAQYGGISTSELVALKLHKTYFVLDDGDTSKYNIAIKKATENYWKFNSYEFISFSKFEELKKDVQNCFVVKVHNGISGGMNADGSQHYSGPGSDGLVLTQGGAPFFRYPKTSVIHLPLKNWDIYALVEDIFNTESYDYKLGSYLQMMQKYAATIEASGESKLGYKKMLKIYNANKDVLNKKTLLINVDDMKDEQFQLESGIKKIYTKNFKLVTADVIERAIEKQDPEVIILHCYLASGMWQYFVTEAKEGKVIYCNLFKPNHISHNLTHMLEDLAK